MKYKFFYTLFAVSFLFSCSHEKQNVITGKIEGLQVGDRIFLSVEDTEGSLWVPTDSTVVTKAEEFTLKTKETGCYVRLTYLKSGEIFKPENAQVPRCFLETYANLNITGNTENWYYIKTTGGLYSHPDMQEINHLTDSAKLIQKEGIALLNEVKETQDTATYAQAIKLIYQSNDIFESSSSLGKKFMKNHPEMAYSAALLRYDYDLMKDFDQYEEAYNALSPDAQNSPAGVIIKNFITNKRASEIGAIAPDFSLKALDGQQITLSEWRGKYILLDFWGSWCGPCRQSSPQLVAFYNDLKKENADIEFIGIACEEQGDAAWIKAIEDDHLPWIQLCDAHSAKGKSIQKQYAINGVPTSILISPEGEIIYKEHPLTIIPKVRELLKLL